MGELPRGERTGSDGLLDAPDLAPSLTGYEDRSEQRRRYDERNRRQEADATRHGYQKRHLQERDDDQGDEDGRQRAHRSHDTDVPPEGLRRSRHLEPLPAHGPS